MYDWLRSRFAHVSVHSVLLLTGLFHSVEPLSLHTTIYLSCGENGPLGDWLIGWDRLWQADLQVPVGDHKVKLVCSTIAHCGKLTHGSAVQFSVIGSNTWSDGQIHFHSTLQPIIIALVYRTEGKQETYYRNCMNQRLIIVSCVVVMFIDTNAVETYY